MVPGHELAATFRVRYVSPEVLGKHAAVHYLTTFGRRHELGPQDVWIASDLRRFSEILLLHEAVECALRERGWDYRSSHEAAMTVERNTYGGTPFYERFLEAAVEPLTR